MRHAATIRASGCDGHRKRGRLGSVFVNRKNRRRITHAYNMAPMGTDVERRLSRSVRQT
jgi:hypothetical protein